VHHTADRHLDALSPLSASSCGATSSVPPVDQLASAGPRMEPRQVMPDETPRETLDDVSADWSEMGTSFASHRKKHRRDRRLFTCDMTRATCSSTQKDNLLLERSP